MTTFILGMIIGGAIVTTIWPLKIILLIIAAFMAFAISLDKKNKKTEFQLSDYLKQDKE